MKKIHTRVKRTYGISTHTNAYEFLHPKQKKHRPKTFKTEEMANKWAKEHGFKDGEYSLKKVKKGKKFQVVKKGED